MYIKSMNDIVPAGLINILLLNYARLYYYTYPRYLRQSSHKTQIFNN